MIITLKMERMMNGNSVEDCSESDKYRSERRDLTFPVFTNNTDEKIQTIKITGAFLDGYLPKLIDHLTVVDWGVGDGDLSVKVAEYMKSKCNNVRYEGIDRSAAFVEKTTSKLLTLGIKNNNIILGSFSSGDVDKLAQHPTLLIASQIIFYADVKEFIERVVKKMGLVAIIIGQATGSFLDHLGKEYDNSSKFTGTEGNASHLISQKEELNSIKILYSSTINFPRDISFDKLKNIALSDFNELKKLNNTDYNIRCLLEFIAGSPMERLACMKKLDYFLQDVGTHLNVNENKISFWNFMSIIVPKNNSSIRHGA